MDGQLWCSSEDGSPVTKMNGSRIGVGKLTGVGVVGFPRVGSKRAGTAGGGIEGEAVVAQWKKLRTQFQKIQFRSLPRIMLMFLHVQNCCNVFAAFVVRFSLILV